jgi:hypothetical protein
MNPAIHPFLTAASTLVALPPEGWGFDATTVAGKPAAAGVGSAFGAGAGVVFALVIIGAAAWWFLSSRNRKKTQRERYDSVQSRYGTAAPRQTEEIARLRSRAGSLLVETDDVIARSEQEIAFAEAQFGEDQIRPFQTAVEQAKGHMRRSFQLQKQLDDEIPDSEEDQRAWLEEIVHGCEDAQESLKKHEQNFADLRQLERNAPDALESLHREIRTWRDKIPDAESRHAELMTAYSPEATASVADNPPQATDRLDFAEHAATRAQDLLNEGNTSEAVVSIRSGEEAVGQARTLVESIDHARRDLDHADSALRKAIDRATSDLAEARSLMERGTFADLTGPAANVETVVADIEEQRTQGPIDPLTLSSRLAESRKELDRGLESVRNQNERDRAARETLAHTMVSAQARLTSASDYVRARRGGIQAEARTRLGEAERNLEEAESLRLSDPSGALNRANQAIRLAEDAQRMASGDVDDFARRGHGPEHWNGSAALGGILFGSGYGRPGRTGGIGGPGIGGPGMGGPGFGGGFTGQGL